MSCVFFFQNCVTREEMFFVAIRNMEVSVDALTGFSSVFLAAAAAVSAGGVMINLHNNFGTLVTDGTITCVADASGACSLGGSYGNGVLAINILSVVFNGILFMMMVWKWMQMRNVVNGRLMNGVFATVSVAVMLAIATSSFNIYEQQNFGAQLTSGAYGTTCPAVTGLPGCTSLSGSRGDVMQGLNATTVAFSGLVLLFYSGVMWNRWFYPGARRPLSKIL
jgi:hypothetical protein